MDKHFIAELLKRSVDPLIDAAIRHTVKIEGGFVNDKDDPGGPTQHGVSLRYAKGIGLDLDGDGDTDIDDIRLVTVDDARGLYTHDFYFEPKIDRLPVMIQPHVFDFAVNSGAARAIMEVQDVCNRVRIQRGDAPFDVLVEDGRLGKQSIAAAAWCQKMLGPKFNNWICQNREDFMRRLAKHNPKFNKYIVARDGSQGGWIKRVRSFHINSQI